MTTPTEPEIILYDLACIKNVCFSPVVWGIRLMLNYKQVPYKTIFLEFPDIEPTVKEFGIVPGEGATGKYTVPVIHHVPTNTHIMDSKPIAQFLEKTYPDPPVPLTSELAREIESKSREVIGPVFRDASLPREVYVLSPRSQEYFRRTREAQLGHLLEDLLAPGREEKMWKSVEGSLQELSDMLRTNRAEGPFVLGARPSYVDFFMTGALQFARELDEGTFQRFMVHPGFKEVYEACLPFMNKRD